MCLCIKANTGINVADTDIVCYKFYSECRDGRLWSPYRSTLIGNVGKIEGKKIVADAFYDDMKISVEHGIHTYSDLVEARLIVGKDALEYLSICNRIYKCIIPKGTKYYIGEDNDLCSECIIIDKCIVKYDGYTMYQPLHKISEELPQEMDSFKVFLKISECKNWLKKHGYNVDNYNIVKYGYGDIEDPRLMYDYH